MTVNAFDYWGAWSGRTGPVAPLHGLSDTDYTTPSVVSRHPNLKHSLCSVTSPLRFAAKTPTLQEDSINGYLAAGAEPSKIVLAITTMARSWTLEDTDSNGYGAFTGEPGKAGPHTQTEGALGYNEVGQHDCPFH